MLTQERDRDRAEAIRRRTMRQDAEAAAAASQAATNEDAMQVDGAAPAAQQVDFIEEEELPTCEQCCSYALDCY